MTPSTPSGPRADGAAARVAHVQPIPMSAPDITAAEIAAVNEVLRTPYLSIGPRISEFEERFAAAVGARHAVGVSSGTAALHLCAIAAGVGEGDLVITTPFSFVASANVILYERASPVFVDIDPVTLNIDPVQVAAAADALMGGPDAAARRWLPPALHNRAGQRRPKALLPVHAFGQPADMDPLLETARTHDLAVIEDACEAVGAGYKGRTVGGGAAGDFMAIASCFAFYPNKQMTVGEGGMITTRRDDWDALFRSLRNQGYDVFDPWLAPARLGYNYRLDELSAALGVAQLARLDVLLAKRERVAGWYNERLRDINLVELPHVAPTTTRMSWFVYVIRLASSVDRDAVMRRLGEEGIPARRYFTPIHLQPFYRERFGFRPGAFPVTEAAAKRVLALPFFGNLTESQVSYVCDRLAAALNEGEG